MDSNTINSKKRHKKCFSDHVQVHLQMIQDYHFPEIKPTGKSLNQNFIAPTQKVILKYEDIHPHHPSSFFLKSSTYIYIQMSSPLKYTYSTHIHTYIHTYIQYIPTHAFILT